MHNRGSEAHLDRLLKLVDPINPNVGSGFRAPLRNAYKRATLLFENLDWLKKILLDTEHPVLLIFAGKAHPADIPGQDLIRKISYVSRMPEFEGEYYWWKTMICAWPAGSLQAWMCGSTILSTH